jgi:hypothetical protein
MCDPTQQAIVAHTKFFIINRRIAEIDELVPQGTVLAVLARALKFNGLCYLLGAIAPSLLLLPIVLQEIGLPDDMCRRVLSQ